MDARILLPRPHQKQERFLRSQAKRKVIKAGRRGGKTKGAGIMAVEDFLKLRRVLYAAPTSDQLEAFWKTVTRALQDPIDKGVFYKNETEHVVELLGTDARIKAKTAWNADMMRGDYADKLILDEWQLMNEGAWGEVGAPMLLDNNGDAVFIFTPRSLRSRSISKAKDPQHASKMFQRAQADKSGRWEAFFFKSMDNPHLSREALEEITSDMTRMAYLMEIEAQDINEAPGAVWKRKDIDDNRVDNAPASLERVVVGVDPSATSEGDEAGIITAGQANGEGFVLADDSIQGSPLTWGKAAVAAYHRFSADRIVAEANNGGEMVALTIKVADPNVPVELVHASRGKATRAEPIAAKYEKALIHHVGNFEKLEDEMCLWVPGDPSPNRMDALVWALTDLMLGGIPGVFFAGGRNASN